MIYLIKAHTPENTLTHSHTLTHTHTHPHTLIHTCSLYFFHLLKMLFQFHQPTLILKLPPGLCFQKVFNSSRCDKKQKLVKSFTIFFRALNEPQLEEQWAFTGFYNWWQTKFYLPSVKARRAVVRSVRRRVYCLNCANSKTFSYFQVSYFLSGVRDEE